MLLWSTGKDFAVAIGSSSCGDTLEDGFGKGWYWEKKKQPLGLLFDNQAELEVVHSKV